MHAVVLQSAVKHLIYATYTHIVFAQYLFRYLQLDSWWYYKSKNFEALKEWTARPEVFPNGLR